MEEIKWLIIVMATLSILGRTWYIVTTLREKEENDNVIKVVILGKLIAMLVWFYIIIKLI